MVLRKALLLVVALTFLTNELSSFADTLEIKAEPMIDDSDDKSDSDDLKEDSRDKRSGEEIMFGNQQNKANGLVDDILAMGDKSKEETDAKNDTQKQEEEDDSKSEEALKDDDKSEEKRNSIEEPAQNTNEMDSDGSEVSSRWYSSDPVSNEALQYLLNRPAVQEIGPSEDFMGLYKPGDLYRRKRQLMIRPVALMKRSFRSPIGQMIRGRSARVPRRSMRLKRQVDVENILSLLRDIDANSNNGNSYYKPVANRLNSFRYHENGFGYPYDVTENDVENVQEDEDTPKGKSDVSDAILYSPSRYIDYPEQTLPYRSKAEQNEAVPEWMEGGVPQPSIFTVSRRSIPLFYPIDYRYIPGHKKRSFSADENDAQEGNFGKWGRVVQVPEAYASPKDIARLYYLANMLTEQENPGVRNRRSA